jgi:hypothetical protein
MMEGQATRPALGPAALLWMMNLQQFHVVKHVQPFEGKEIEAFLME